MQETLEKEHNLNQEVIISSPRRFGKNTKQLLSFYGEGMRGKRIIIKTTEGNFYSPEAAKNLEIQARQDERERIVKMVEEEISEMLDKKFDRKEKIIRNLIINVLINIISKIKGRS